MFSGEGEARDLRTRTYVTRRQTIVYDHSDSCVGRLKPAPEIILQKTVCACEPQLITRPPQVRGFRAAVPRVV